MNKFLMPRKLKQKDIDNCIKLINENSLYDNLRTRMLAFLQMENSYSYGYFQNGRLLGFVFFSNNAFDLTVSFLEVKDSNEVVMKNLVNLVKEQANLLGAKAIYVNKHNLTKELLNLLEILEQYRLE